MSIESRSNLVLSFGLNRQGGFELRTATLTDSKEVRGSFHDAELALCHDSSLPPRREPVDLKRHHYPRDRFGLAKPAISGKL
jgi:hypothetical protein